MGPFRGTLAWALFLGLVGMAVWFASTSPLLAWRGPVYIVAGLSGVIALALMLFQPFLATGELQGAKGPRGQRFHRLVGTLLVVLVCAHVAGLWLTSPPDVLDALLFRSPTPFSVWGVVAMWALFSAAGGMFLRKRWKVAPRVSRRMHGALVAVVVSGTVIHALQIEGTMETVTKALLCAAVVAALARALWQRGTFSGWRN